MSRLAVFGYGSLVNEESAGLTLGRPVEAVIPARLPGWRRRWTTGRDNLRSEKTFAHADDGSVPPFTLGLNIEPDPESPGPNGALIEVSEAEADRLALREMRYDRIDVTETIEAEGFDTVIAWTVKPAHHHDPPPSGAVILRPYVRAVEAAFDTLGPGELDLFRKTTEPPPVPIIPATLIRDEIPVGNPRAW
jgi:hypothetical protein